MHKDDQAYRLVAANEMLQNINVDCLSIQDIDRIIRCAGFDPECVHAFIRKMIQVNIGPQDAPVLESEQVRWATNYLKVAIRELFTAGGSLSCVMLALNNVVLDSGFDYSKLQLGRANGEKQRSAESPRKINGVSC